MTGQHATLDDSQLAVIATPVDGRQIVLAGPGAGKTEVVGRLAERFVEDGVYPDEILVISFSRAALIATRRRTDRIIEQGQGLVVVTIDSLAAQIVVDHEEGKAPFGGFDATVARATDLLDATVPRLNPISHVIVDEVQDVVGVRASFVLALLKTIVADGAGFTLLGDPLQAIYEFQLGKGNMNGPELLDAVRDRFGAVDRSLTGEYRTRNEHAASAATARVGLTGLDAETRLKRLDALTVELPPLGNFDKDAIDDVSGWSGSTALICDTNIRAALVAQQATELGLAVETVANRTDTALAPWIACRLQNHPGTALSREEFLSLGGDDPAVDWPERWRLLLTVTRGRRELSLRDLCVALRTVWRTRSLERTTGGEIVASTVHRAKGLEFDNVVLIDTDRWDRREDETADAASRRLFVALTRARNRLARVRGIDTRGWFAESLAGNRVWIRRQLRTGTRGRPVQLLVEPWMARANGPVDVDLSGTVGAPVTWVRSAELVTIDGDVLPSWTAHIGDAAVARTGEEFGRMVALLTDSTLTRLPHLLGGRVEGIETVTGQPAPDGPGRHGFWTGARIAGTITLTRNMEGH